MRRWVISVLLGSLAFGALAHWAISRAATHAPAIAPRTGPQKQKPGQVETRQRPLERLSAKVHDPGLPVTLTNDDGQVTVLECEELTAERITSRGTTSYGPRGLGTGTKLGWHAFGCLDAGCGVSEEGGRAWGTRVLHFARGEGKSSLGGRCQTPVTAALTRGTQFSARFFVDRSVLESTGVFAIGLHSDVFHPRYETNLAVINLRSPDLEDEDGDGNTSELGPAELRVGAPRRSRTLPLEPFIGHWTEIKATIEKRQRPGPSEHLCTFEIVRETGDGQHDKTRFRNVPCDLPPSAPWQLEAWRRSEPRLVTGQGGGKIVVNSRAGSIRHGMHDGSSYPYANLPVDAAGRDDGFILVERISWE